MGRPPQELMRDGVCNNSSIRIPDLTADWEFGPHVTVLKESRREAMVGRGKNMLAKSAEMRRESPGLNEEWKR